MSQRIESQTNNLGISRDQKCTSLAIIFGKGNGEDHFNLVEINTIIDHFYFSHGYDVYDLVINLIPQLGINS